MCHVKTYLLLPVINLLPIKLKSIIEWPRAALQDEDCKGLGPSHTWVILAPVLLRPTCLHREVEKKNGMGGGNLLCSLNNLEIKKQQMASFITLPIASNMVSVNNVITPLTSWESPGVEGSLQNQVKHIHRKTNSYKAMNCRMIRWQNISCWISWTEPSPNRVVMQN